jgi:hypothetical protein
MSVESSLECEISMSGELRQLKRGLLQISDRCCLDLSIKEHGVLAGQHGAHSKQLQLEELFCLLLTVCFAIG